MKKLTSLVLCVMLALSAVPALAGEPVDIGAGEFCFLFASTLRQRVDSLTGYYGDVITQAFPDPWTQYSISPQNIDDFTVIASSEAGYGVILLLDEKGNVSEIELQGDFGETISDYTNDPSDWMDTIVILNVGGLCGYIFGEEELEEYVPIWLAPTKNSQRPAQITVGKVVGSFEYDADGNTHFYFRKE